MRNYYEAFMKEEDGIETIEFIGLIAVAAVLIVTVMNIATGLGKKAGSTKEALSGKMGEINGKIASATLD